MTEYEKLFLDKINKLVVHFKGEAERHKRIYRWLWLVSAAISLMIAIISTLKISICQLNHNESAALLSIILPVVTGYLVLRTPEKLWILEVNTRNKLKDLATEYELKVERGATIDTEEYERRFIEIMTSANEKWVKLKDI